MYVTFRLFVFWLSNDQLVIRGYIKYSVFNEFFRIAQINREEFIPYKDKSDNRFEKSENLLFFKLPFDMNINQESLRLSLNTASNELKSNFGFDNIKIKLINSMQLNFNNIFIHGGGINIQNKFSFKRCHSLNCIICKFANTNYYLRLNEFILPILSNSSCISKNVVYIIECIFCSSFYIGQSENLYIRLKTHIRKCRMNFISKDSNCTNIIKHFHSNNFCNFSHFSFFVFRNNISDKFERLNIESQLINLFLDLGVKDINEFIPDKYYWYRNAKLFEVLN